jgi:DNA polymerase III delta prime subunit
MKKEHSLWIERFRPQTLQQYVCSADLKEKFQSFIDSNDIPHLILAGSAGLGKSSLARLLVNNINCDYIILNASDENGIDIIREKVKSFASSASFKPLKVVILEEASFLTGPAQEALKNIIEEFSEKTRFVFTANYLGKIVNPIQSRCEVYEFTAPSKGEVAKHVIQNILDVVGIEYDLKEVAQLINDCYPDIRATVKYLQANTLNSKFKYNSKNTYLNKQILDALVKPSKTVWADIRQLIANQPMDDYQPLIEYLFKHVDEYSKGNEAEIIIELDNHQFFQKSVPDKEINIMAMFSKIIKTITKKQIL